MSDQQGPEAATQLTVPDLLGTMRSVLHDGASAPGVQLVHGRAVAVFASPELSNAQHFAAGISLLPADGITPEQPY